MYLGLNDTDAQVATFYHRQMVANGKSHQQLDCVLTAASRPGSATTAIRRWLRPLLVHANAFLMVRESDYTTAGKQGAGF